MSENPLWLLRDQGRAKWGGPDAVASRRRARLAEMVTFARAHSPYYREIYRGLPEKVEDPSSLPVTDKKQLMARFDDWATDRAVTIEKARAFVGDPDLVGEPFMSWYTVATTSGTTFTTSTIVRRHSPSVGVRRDASVASAAISPGSVSRR